jgi:transposase-like protein
MVGHGSKFGRKKEAAIAALLSQRSVAEAAHLIGIAERTLWRWLREPDFRAEYLAARREAVLQAHARMQQNCGAAASVLLKIMVDPSSPASVRARAAQCILERASQSLEQDDLEVRIARLEAAHQRKESEAS